MRRFLHLLAALALGTGASLAAGAPASADVPPNVATYGTFGYATGVHVIGYTDAYPNFSSGAIDNHYPLAKVRQDASPLTDATATFSDIGPFGQTVTACSDASQCANRPGVPYANAHYPGGKSTDRVDSCSPSAAASGQASACPTSAQPASYADAKASELSADASGYYAGGGTQPFSGAMGESHTIVKDDGALTLTSHSTVLNASFAGGQIQISKVDVTTVVNSAGGSTTADAHVTVGQVLINGQPTSVTDQGVTVQQNQVIPCSAAPALPQGIGSGAAAPACVPQVETDTFKVFTVAPKKTVSGNHATVSASGLHVLVTQPSSVPGAPQQRVEYVIGEAFGDGQLTGQTAGTDSAAGDTSVAGTAGGYGDLGGDMGSPADAGDAGGGAPVASAAPAAQHVAVLLTANRRPLALLFLAWECLILAAASAWVWSRRVRARLAAEAIQQ
jgi:hypothetical protein